MTYEDGTMANTQQNPSWVSDIAEQACGASRFSSWDAPSDEHPHHKQFNIYLCDSTGALTREEAEKIASVIPGGQLAEYDPEAPEGDILALIETNHPDRGDDVARLWVMNTCED